MVYIACAGAPTVKTVGQEGRCRGFYSWAGNRFSVVPRLKLWSQEARCRVCTVVFVAGFLECELQYVFNIIQNNAAFKCFGLGFQKEV